MPGREFPIGCLLITFAVVFITMNIIMASSSNMLLLNVEDILGYA